MQYRYVQPEGDDVDQLQCLACGERMYVSALPLNFCPRCGVKFTSCRLSRRHGVPRWCYERGGNDHGYANPRCVTLRRAWEWVIDERTKWPGEPWSEWREYRRELRDRLALDNWRRVRNVLIELRNQARSLVIEDDVDMQYEYRVRLETTERLPSTTFPVPTR